MSDIQQLLKQLDQLDDEEIQEVSEYIEALRARRLINETPEQRLKAVRELLDNFWEGVPQHEVDEIVDAINSEWIDTSEDDLWDWIDNLSDDER